MLYYYRKRILFKDVKYLKKILVRSGMTPLDNFSAKDIYLKDRTGYNNGNLAYQFSIYRTLWQEDVEMYADGLTSNPNLAAKINEEYDLYILPFADAFREDFRATLRNYTALIKQLKIPVIVTGIGLRANYEPNLKEGFPFDDDVRAFVKAVLEKSTKLGLRGQITADYLLHLGFHESDFEIIGCPSLYTFGRHLHIRDLQLKTDSLLAINASPLSRESSLQFLNQTIDTYKNYYFIPQHLDELYIAYAGGPDISSEEPSYPTSIEHKYYQEGRIKYFTSMPSWYDFMKQVDLSIGSRLHGNVIPTICGTPNISFVQDARMRELASYHNLPHVTADKLETIHDLDELLQTVDLKSAEKVQARNFDNFISFLDENELAHIYKNDKNRLDAPLDAEIAPIEFSKSPTVVTQLKGDQLIERVHLASNLQNERQDYRLRYHINLHQNQIKQLKNKIEENGQIIARQNVTIQNLEQKVKQLDKHLSEKDVLLEAEQNQSLKLKQDIQHYQGTLNRKAVKATLRIADSFASLKKT